ncbi:DUF4349 domain-containing protein [Cochleicola gelatinilyticus]|uniref:DUF4349 domain-containing protein n=1 Tax=Cochleicola gelatinilyticus TaxID=1763537 RepID=A0A167J274_9FLAO|nr:DUF4349 domain-containing protein [Cochleicola gelatinilyticus]OAB80260.1 hypothetical protein ULVI_05860 [Cochleicola gelatinilyticus]
MKTISLFLFGFVLACSQGGSPPPYASETAEIVYKDAADELSPSVEMVEETISNESSEISEQKIIKTARLSFETQEVVATYNRIIQLAEQHKAIIQNDNSGKGYNRITQNITLRVPTENFQSFINGVSEGVAYFDLQDISRQDVTEEFVDLEARLKAKRELEKRYLELLSQAKNVKEMLEIERELSKIREEIEAKQGRLKYLQSRVSMSTVHIEFYKITAETGITQSYGQKIKNALQGGWDGVSVFFLGIIYLWPLFVLAVLVLLFVRIIVLRKRKNKKPNN